MKQLKLKYDWATILDLSEEHDIDFFKIMASPLEFGLKSLITTVVVGAQGVDKSVTREMVVDYLRSTGTDISEGLSAIFEEIAKSLPKAKDGESSK